MRNATNRIAACALLITCSISNATPASVKKTKLTKGCNETKDECNDFEPMVLKSCCCANLFAASSSAAVLVVVAAEEKLPLLAQNIPQHTHTNSGSNKNNRLETTNIVVE